MQKFIYFDYNKNCPNYVFFFFLVYCQKSLMFAISDCSGMSVVSCRIAFLRVASQCFASRRQSNPKKVLTIILHQRYLYEVNLND